MVTPELFSEDELRMMPILAENTDFMSSTTARENCYWACDLFAKRCDDRLRVPIAAIGRILGLNRGQVSRNWDGFRKQGNKNQKAGRPWILTHDEQGGITNEILSAFVFQEQATDTI
jgi:hypothetical protein